ncbi:Yos1-like protein [Lentinula lateritia]|uniref:Yos1-like protein n=1 Tax=Lentinula aff. lateritia TaxID=2804960 RepID=A0ACC1UEW5_9AGAR|nr:Yos1-like protein [Lentinula aff. lateritia]KAJ3857382.1 Yos1-like protein [Lentinula lateritia]
MLGTILYVSILLVNAMAVLSEDRFLARIGWTSARPQSNNNPGFQSYDQPAFGQEVAIKTKIIDLISAVRTLLRIPLIAVNIIVILYELILGG